MMVPIVAFSLLALAGSALAEISFTRHVASTSSSLEAAVLPDAQFSTPISAKVPRRKAKKSLLNALRAKGRGTEFTGAVAGMHKCRCKRKPEVDFEGQGPTLTRNI